MKTTRSLRSALCCVGLLLLAPSAAFAAPELREQMDLRGNFVLFGSTLAQECASDAPDPVVGTVGTCPDSNLFAPDVFWRADDPANGAARADSSVTAAQARSTAVLVLPDGAEVAYARIYWGGLLANNAPDTSIQVQRVDGNVDETITADDSTSLAQSGTNRFFYQSTADVTELVQEHGVGAYRIAGVNSILSGSTTGAVAAWYMVVFYELDGEASRNLAIFDGLDYVELGTSVSATLSGFVVPAVGFDATLGVVAYEGEEQLEGDQLLFNGMPLMSGLNPSDNFFNATRTRFGMPVSNEGDLPRLSGAEGSYSNVDMDVIDVTSRVSGGNTSATIGASSTIDIFVLSAFVTSISTLLPDFTPSSKEVVDVDGDVAAPGDVLEYRIVARNDGSDAAIGVTVRDELPAGVTFVPGSLRIEDGANMGTKTDAAGDDQIEYDAASRTIVARLGAGANGTAGGKLEIGETSELRFQVTVDAATRGEVENQGVITAEGEQGAEEADTETDADPDVEGQGPTVITVEECESDAECKPPTPFCDIAKMPRKCVGCANSAQCDDPNLPDCDPDTNTCVCKMGPRRCVDTDDDGISDGGEDEIGTDPMDADTDDDGVIDGSEIGPTEDNDGDGVINALDPDSDNDGLPDGLEQGLQCDHIGTDRGRGHCRPDGDRGATKTNPVDADTDDGGATDGSEDFDLDGVIDAGETDPTLGHGADDSGVKDSDNDKLGDDLEDNLGSDPNDADTDEDGVTDGAEPNVSLDSDKDGAISVLDVDSDNDGLYDGTELGLGCSNPATDASKMHCIADADMGATKTSPVDPDTDDGGLSDGEEDLNRNGRVDGGERNPVKGQGADDAGSTDADMDGLSDQLEDAIGTNKNDADTDDDGLLDGEEANPADDQDNDGAINARDPDSDGDMLFDGTELGKNCSSPATDATKMTCRADADNGATKTSPVLPDTDNGGIVDGKEDRNQDGRIDPGETNPNDPADDVECMMDSDCPAGSGTICVMDACVPGCRNGMGCPMGQRCTSDDMNPGLCEPLVTPHFGGGGCKCGVDAGGTSGEGLGSALLILAGLAVATRKRRGATRIG